jgi:hypothetical protein
LIPGKTKRIFLSSIVAIPPLGLILLPSEYHGLLPTWVERPRREADHSLESSAEVYNLYYTITSSWCGAY